VITRWIVTLWSKRPRTIRLRLTIRYAALFLVAGAALLAVSYGLVDHNLSGGPTSKLTSTQVAEAQKLCAVEKSTKAGCPAPRSAVESCVNAYTAGFATAKRDQRASVLNDLLLLSLVCLGALTVASGGLGWWMARRVLRPVRAITAAARRASEENLAIGSDWMDHRTS